MKRFLYFLPGLTGANPRILQDRGLLDRFTRGAGPGSGLLEHTFTAVDDGPAGSGVIVAAGPQPPAAPAKMAWLEQKNFWLAIEQSDAPPGPDDLIRPTGISGYELQLADANAWRVPLLHRWDAAKLMHVPNLPRSMRPKMEGGKYRYENAVRQEYAAADQMATQIFESFVKEQTVTLEQAYERAAAVLAVNYRIGVEEAGMLGILDEERIVTLLGLCVDYPNLRRQCAAEASTGLVHQE